MALDIIPGYDFTVNEVPTFGKFIQAATGLNITGLNLDQVNSTLIGQVTGAVCGTTGASLPAEGWLWTDPENNIWVETRWLPPTGESFSRAACPLWRVDGGWASVRWPIDFAVTLDDPIEGGSVLPNDRFATTEREVIFSPTSNNYLSDGGRFFGVLNETPNSTVTFTRHVTVGRGITPIFSTGGVPENPGNVGRRLQRDAGGIWSIHLQSADATRRTWIGSIMNQDPGSELSAGSWITKVSAWMLAGPIWGP